MQYVKTYIYIWIGNINCYNIGTVAQGPDYQSKIIG